ncbi:MAG TPA: hypothetical protein VGH33_02435 [Isosphaeraceae bacterium]
MTRELIAHMTYCTDRRYLREMPRPMRARAARARRHAMRRALAEATAELQTVGDLAPTPPPWHGNGQAGERAQWQRWEGRRVAWAVLAAVAIEALDG